MNIEVVPISKVKQNKGNPRTIDTAKFEKLVNSIKEFPEMMGIRPIVVDENMTVLGGNMRLKACRKAGLKKVSIIKADGLTEDQKKEFIIKDNVSFGEWDWTVLEESDWEDSPLADWGLEAWGEEEQEKKGYEPNPDFDDEGVAYKSQYGVIVYCPGETEQKEVFENLTEQGYKCKIVVT